jgi:hypothetical protein
MLINDLSYLGNTQENELIFGGGNVFIGATATVGGDNSLTTANTNLEKTIKRDGIVQVDGTGLAVAIGENPKADTFYGIEGYDRANVKTRYRANSTTSVETVKIKATDRP